MGIATSSLRLLWPKGLAHRLNGHGQALLGALGSVLDDVRASARGIIDESRPGTATFLLPEWHDTLGVVYDSSRPLEEQRQKLESIRTSLGGMTLNDLQRQIARELPGIIVSEVASSAISGLDEAGVSRCGGVEGDYSPTYYDISGTVTDDYQEGRLDAILDHFSPLHLIPSTTAVVNLSLTATAEAGLATAGLEQAGYNGS
jgi:hypothetical protein